MSGHILIVDDDPELGEMLAVGLRLRGLTCEFVAGATEALERIASDDFDAVMTDMNMPVMGGLELCRGIGDRRPDVPVIVMTAYGSFDAAVEAIRSGAYDFVTKPFDLDVVALSIERAIRHRHLRDEVRRLRLAISESQHFENVIGSSRAMQGVYDLLTRLSDSDATVMVSGESGTGKEIVARALHKRSRRSEGPFIAINCAAVPENLLERELFGHVRGALTVRELRNAMERAVALTRYDTLAVEDLPDKIRGHQASHVIVAGQDPSELVTLEEVELRNIARVMQVAGGNKSLAAQILGLDRKTLYRKLNILSGGCFTRAPEREGNA